MIEFLYVMGITLILILVFSAGAHYGARSIKKRILDTPKAVWRK